MEIGSEFWESGDTGRKKYLLSGRTALEYIIRDILREHKVDSVLMPSYCCHTMIEPFVKHGIRVRFYDVFYDAQQGLCVDIPEPYKNEIFYLMSYFGFSKISGISFTEIQDSYQVILEDETHSWLQNGKRSIADYTYASCRKWTGFYGIAEAVKRSGAFTIGTGNTGEAYSCMRQEAMQMKRKYIEKQFSDKQQFLARYAEAEQYLEENYVDYEPTLECMVQYLNTDWDFIKEQRRKNAKILIQGIKNISGRIQIYKDIEETDTPLFVPVLIEKDRDKFRKYMIDQQVYCPVHWPLSKYHEGLSERGKKLYKKELSLVCDQRYGERDMERIVHLVEQYFKEGV